MRYLQVILPIKFRETVTYSLPEALEPSVKVGSRVNVMLSSRKYKGYVESITDTPMYEISKIRPILSVDSEICASEGDLKFWKAISSYYMCTLGEALKAATPFLMELITKTGRSNLKEKIQPTPSPQTLPHLTQEGKGLCSQVVNYHTSGDSVLLRCDSSSLRGDILLHLVKNAVERGKDCLILTPDIARSRATEKRLSLYFPTNTISYHSGQTPAKRRNVTNSLIRGEHPHIVVGLRSSLFLPFKNLGLIVVLDENDPLYKQTEPAPRYHGRDGALFLAQIWNANILLTSQSPSFEAIYNINTGKFKEVSHFSSSPKGRVDVIDYSKELHSHSVTNGVANRVLPLLRRGEKRGEKVVIYIPKWAFKKDDLPPLEWTLYDDISEIEKLKVKPSQILVLNGEAFISKRSFRGDENAIYSISKLVSQVGESGSSGVVYIQTTLFKHSLFRYLSGDISIDHLLEERREAFYPPFSRAIHITLSGGKDVDILRRGEEVKKVVIRSGISAVFGPTPISEGEVLLQLFIPKGKGTKDLKEKLRRALSRFDNLIIDVDPY